MLVLEERERALARGAKIYAEILGYGLTNDAHHMTVPRPDGRQAARAMRLALAEAHITPGEMGYINAHGSSTPLNDPTETVAIRQVFGEHAARRPGQRHQGLLWPCARARAAQSRPRSARWPAATAGSRRPSTCERPTPPATWTTSPAKGRDADPEYILSNSFGFGGINACLVFRREDGR